MRPTVRRRGVVVVEVVITGFVETGATLRDINDALVCIQQSMRDDARTGGEGFVRASSFDDFVKVKVTKTGDLVFRYKTQVAQR